MIENLEKKREHFIGFE